jgi:hypothetical protein
MKRRAASFQQGPLFLGKALTGSIATTIANGRSGMPEVVSRQYLVESTHHSFSQWKIL